MRVGTNVGTLRVKIRCPPESPQVAVVWVRAFKIPHAHADQTRLTGATRSETTLQGPTPADGWLQCCHAPLNTRQVDRERCRRSAVCRKSRGSRHVGPVRSPGWPARSDALGTATSVAAAALAIAIGMRNATRVTCSRRTSTSHATATVDRFGIATASTRSMAPKAARWRRSARSGSLPRVPFRTSATIPRTHGEALSILRRKG